MLRAGWATTYTQVLFISAFLPSKAANEKTMLKEGAEYGIIGKDEHSRIEKEAKQDFFLLLEFYETDLSLELLGVGCGLTG